MPSRLMYSPNPGRGQASWSEAALGVTSRRAKFIPTLEAEGFLWLFCKSRFRFLGDLFQNDPKLIGFGGLRQFTEDGGVTSEVEILYGVAPERWGKGIATEAAGAVLRYGFEERELAHIYAE